MGDAYNPQLIRFSELRDMGYPVGLEVGPPDYRDELTRQLSGKLRQQHLECQEVDAELYGDKWAMPTIYEPGFSKYLGIESLAYDKDNLGAPFYSPLLNTKSDYVAIKEAAVNHPVRLVDAVGECSVKLFTSYEKHMQEGTNPQTIRPVNMQALLPACFIAVMRRSAQRKATGDPFIKPIDKEVENRYLTMQRNGVQPVQHTVLRQLVRDFYTGLERRSASFKQFKKQ